MALTITGLPFLALALASLLSGFIKGARVRNLPLFLLFALLQSGATGVQLFSTFAAVPALASTLSTAVYAGAAAAALLLLLVDLAASAAYVRRAVENDPSLSARSFILFGLLPAAVSIAVLFRLGGAAGEVAVKELRVPAGDLALYFGIAGVAVAAVTGLLASFLTIAAALRDDRGNASKGDYFSRAWFALFFLFVPLISILVGVGGLLAPKVAAGGYLYVQGFLMPVVLSNGLAMMRDMLKSTIETDRVDNAFT